jgi:hypothetical protein
MAADGLEALISRLTDVLRADDRVRAAWLSGSFGRGTADRFSDVDVLVAVSSEDLTAFADEWPARAPKVAETVLTQRLGGGSTVVISHVTPQWLRFDLVITTVYQVADHSGSTLRPLFDHDDIHRLLRGRVEWAPPSPDRVGKLITEFFRVLGLLPVVLGRDELFVAASGAGLLRTLVMQLMLEDASSTENGGALHLSTRLSADAMRQLNALPPIVADRDAAVTAHLACAELFLPLARKLASRVGAVWPTALEEACFDYLRRELGIELGIKIQ